jgi:two-component system nitrogen regulation response regulator GlnG
MSEDTSTLTLGPLDTLSGSGRGLPQLPALTIAWHPDVRRVGTIAPLTALLESESAPLDRDQPLFYVPGSNVGRSVDHRGLSRDSVLVVASVGKSLELRRGAATKLEVELDGVPFTGTRRISAEDLSRGLVLTVARQFVFILHGVHFPITRSPPLGLIGTSDAIEDVRRLVSKVADLPAPVLIRGESGTGKELVAKAIHETGQRHSKPFVAVNMSLIRPERAAAELFGYEKGSFTGATGSHPGHFRAAHGGTLFLDEVGELPPDAQPMLLRVLDDHKVQPLGSAQARSVDVRVIAATDAPLEDAVNAGRFNRALFHRLKAAVQLSLPPLRERREDIGLLLVTFLQQNLTAMNALERLAEPPEKQRHWLSARAVAATCLARWVGNIRGLQGLAHELAVRSSDPRFKAYGFVVDYIESDHLLAPQPSGNATAAAAAPLARAGEIGNERILDAFDHVGWNISQAAKVLGIDKSTLSRRLAKEPSIQLLAKTTLAELLRRKEACGGDTALLAEQLGVPLALLIRRLRTPGSGI